jgi:hypothetical protein
MTLLSDILNEKTEFRKTSNTLQPSIFSKKMSFPQSLRGEFIPNNPDGKHPDKGVIRIGPLSWDLFRNKIIYLEVDTIMKYAVLTPDGIVPSYMKNWIAGRELFTSSGSVEHRYMKILVNQPYFLDYLFMDVYENNVPVARYGLSRTYWAGKRVIDFELIDSPRLRRSRSRSPSRSLSSHESSYHSDRSRSIHSRLGAPLEKSDERPVIPVIEVVEPGQIVDRTVESEKLDKLDKVDKVDKVDKADKVDVVEQPELPIEPPTETSTPSNIRPELQSTIDHLRDAYKTFHIGMSVVELGAAMTNNPLNPDERELISTTVNMFKKFAV